MMAERRRYPSSSNHNDTKLTKKADILTFQMIIIFCILGGIWIARYFSLPIYQNVISVADVFYQENEEFSLNFSNLKQFFYQKLNNINIFPSNTNDKNENSTNTQTSSLNGQGGILQSSSIPRGVFPTPLFLSAQPIVPTSGKVTSYFGWRENPLSPGEDDFHTGLDIAAVSGSPVFAALPGRVQDVGYSENYGNYIIISHEAGLETYYCHCQEIIAQTGTNIRRGERIALVGSTGTSTGPHLHFEIRQDGLWSDPLCQLL